MPTTANYIPLQTSCARKWQWPVFNTYVSSQKLPGINLPLMPYKNNFHGCLLSCNRKNDLCGTRGIPTYGKYGLANGICERLRGNRRNRRQGTRGSNFYPKERTALLIQHLNKYRILGTRVYTQLVWTHYDTHPFLVRPIGTSGRARTQENDTNPN